MIDLCKGVLAATLLATGLLALSSAFAQDVEQAEQPPLFEEPAQSEAETADDADLDDTDPDDSESGESAANNPEPESDSPQVNPDATFTPTEEISEDKPVAFPVDI